VAEKVKELEVKLAAVMQELEQKPADMEHMGNANTRLQADIADMDHIGNANTRLQADIAGAFEHSLG
ncbi:hypothetical protein MKW92_045984, partial [Papaver armeniacum]